MGKTPSHAATHFKEILRAKYPDPLEFHESLADRSKLPRCGDFYNLYSQHFKEVFKVVRMARK